MKRVLIVDDAAFMRANIKMMLSNSDFKVIGEAENGKIGVEMYKELSPDIVTMDITMPEMDGIEAIRAIKVLDPDAKVLMISAMGQQSFVMEAIQIGAAGFLVKPFTEGKLIQTLSKI